MPVAMQAGQYQKHEQHLIKSPQFSFGPHLIYSPLKRAGSVERIQEIFELNWGNDLDFSLTSN